MAMQQHPPADLAMQPHPPADMVIVPMGTLPFPLDTAFITSGYMGDSADVNMVPKTPADSTDCNGMRSSATAKGNCHTVTYTPAGMNKWAGVYWQYPANNWGNLAGFAMPTGATKVVFMAKGAKGGEKVKFIVGGLGGGAMPHSDTVMANQTLTLTASWAQYSLDISGQTYVQVIGGFAWAMSAADAGASAAFSVDDIQWK
jgi:hypothetical protein